MSASSQVYVNTSNSSSLPMSSQHEFASNYDMGSPVDAARSYARSMHQHTKKQMDAASRMSRRRDQESGDAMGSEEHEGATHSSRGSVSSVDGDHS